MNRYIQGIYNQPVESKNELILARNKSKAEGLSSEVANFYFHQDRVELPISEYLGYI